MKKYITPQIECFEFEATNIIANSLNSDDNFNKPQGDFDVNTMTPQAREDNNNSNMWNSGW